MTERLHIYQGSEWDVCQHSGARCIGGGDRMAEMTEHRTGAPRRTARNSRAQTRRNEDFRKSQGVSAAPQRGAVAV